MSGGINVARALAQEAYSWYQAQLDPYARHDDNVRSYLRGPVIALTVDILQGGVEACCGSTATTKEEVVEDVKTESVNSTEATTAGGQRHWRAYLASAKNSPEFGGKIDAKNYDALSDRAKARLEAFLKGVELAIRMEDPSLKKDDSTKKTASARPPFALIDGLAGFGNADQTGNTSTTQSSSILRSLSTPAASKKVVLVKRPQIPEEELLVRLELYIRSLQRVVKSMTPASSLPSDASSPEINLGNIRCQECVIASEPPRSIKTRAQMIVVTFVETVGTVRQQGPVLNRLLSTLTMELLAVSVLSDSLLSVIQRLVLEYEQLTSFASLAFLSSPENAADQNLNPMVMKYLRFLQQNWKNCESDCMMENTLVTSLDPVMRRTFKTVEFTSIGHLLEVCQAFRYELQHIELAPGTVLGSSNSKSSSSKKNKDTNGSENKKGGGYEDDEAVQQAIRDLQRETITINGQTLAPVRNRRDLILLLNQTLNSGILKPIVPKRKKKGRRGPRRQLSRESASSSEGEVSQDPQESTSADADSSEQKQQSNGLAIDAITGRPTSLFRTRSFGLSTIDFLTKRLLLAAGRTGTGGDAYFIVRDLFGGDEVEVVPSHYTVLPSAGTATTSRSGKALSSSNLVGWHRPGGGIEILVTLGSVTIRCHGSFDVYPKSMVGECEPLIQIHTVTSETIGLQEVRVEDVTNDNEFNGPLNPGTQPQTTPYDTDDSDAGSDVKVPKTGTILRERITDRTGWRTLSIRPALYERVGVFNTPS